MTSQKFPKIIVTLDDAGAETEHTVRIIYADIVKFDIMRKRYDFPTQDEAPATWMAVTGYAALVRTGVVPAKTTVQEFMERIVMIDEDEPAEDATEGAEFPG